MKTFDLKNYRIYIIIGLIAFFSIFALWLRLIPMFNLGSTDILNVVGSDDPLYNLRQVEQMLHNFPKYAWFDAMTHFPEGDFIYWGPLFTYILAIACLITGAATRPEIIATTLVVPPLMATVLVPIMYYVGKSCGDWKTGLLASGFTAIVSGQFFYRSFYGYLDHHIAETLFSTIFFLAYIFALQTTKETGIDFQRPDTLKKPFLISALAGIAYLLGLFTMPTIVLFALIVTIFTVVQFIIDFYRGQDGGYLVFINGTVFLVAIAGLLLFGIKSEWSIDLTLYSFGHVYAYLGIIGGTLALWLIARFLKGKNRHYYPLALACTGIASSLILYLASPLLFRLLISSLFDFFGQLPVVQTVQEAMSWDLAHAWITFNYGLILMAFGLCILAYKNIKEEHPHQVLILIWSIIILVSTWQHIRYEYYLAVNVTLLCAIAVSFVADLSWRESVQSLGGVVVSSAGSRDAAGTGAGAKRDRKSKKERGKKGHEKSQRDLTKPAVLIVTAALALLFVWTSVGFSYSNAADNPIRMNPDWREALEWLGNNTQDTGVDYYTIYDQKTFRYPPQAYGVMSWWDYGHMITYIAKRIPNANPFQRGVAGDVGAAAYFMTASEDAANSMIDQLGTRYVITDIEMDVGKFGAMSVWFNKTVNIDPYQALFAAPVSAQSGQYRETLLNKQPYFLTMVSRLHNFDGSMTDPQKVYYIEYIDPSIAGVSVPVITNGEIMNSSAALARAGQYNLHAPAGYHAAALSPAIYLPLEQVPALRHYRLVHESPTNVFEVKTPDIKYVKVFEYVKGAHIKGEGIIEVPLISNTGRKFTYRQQSINGEFIVPYSTSGNPYGVKAAGKARIVGTTHEFDVPEDAVMQGLAVS